MKRLSLTLFLSLIGCALSVAQHLHLSDSTVTGTSEYVLLVRLMQRIERFNHEIPQEKVYLHFDNTGYFKGEKIWFKGYVVRTDTGRPTDLSAVLYVELVNPSGEVIQSRKVHVDQGYAVGDFSLDTLFTTGFYEVRAYTKYMLNWGGTGIFSRVFPIFKQPRRMGDYSRLELDRFSYRKRQPNYREVPEELLQDNTKEGENDNQLTMKRLPHGSVHVNFYPEGGNLVEDLPSRVAFAVNDDEGRDFDAEGVILNAEKQLVQGAVTFRQGRGFFDLTPNDEPKYLQLTTADGKKQEFLLPEALPEGITLQLNTLGDPLVVATLSASPSMCNRLMGYTLMHDGQLAFCDTLTCRPHTTLQFEREALPAGVNQLTFFDAEGHILAERLFFICPKRSDDLRVAVSSSTDHLIPCGKVRLDIQAKPNAHLSFSAVDAETMVNGKEGNALTWMLLSSDVKGYIAHPEYYFEDDDREHRIAADLLMMVQGWRRYRWDLMAGNEQFKRIYNIEDKLYLNGVLLDNPKDRPRQDMPLRAYFFNRAGEWVYGDCTTDSVGGYAFAFPDAWGEWNLQLMVRGVYDFGVDGKLDIGMNDRRQDFRVLVDRHFSPQPRWLSPEETDTLRRVQPNLFAETPDSVAERLEDLPILKRERVLKEVRVKGFRHSIDHARELWEDEGQAQRWASIYYDVDKEADIIYDNGGELPEVRAWLYERNPLFQVVGSERFLPTHASDNIEKVKIDKTVKVNETIYENPFENLNAYKEGKIYQAHVQGTSVKRSKQGARIYDDGMNYKGRPIIWILNNGFHSITSATELRLGQVDVFFASNEEFPVWLDEVKSIYLTEDVNASNRYLMCPSLTGRSPVTVFVYTHHRFPWKKNGLRATHFLAYDKPDTFEMDDYSVVPPMEDFRRTLYWVPEVKTDEKGHAQVEFYNNSSARRLFISVEGMTADGEILMNE